MIPPLPRVRGYEWPSSPPRASGSLIRSGTPPLAATRHSAPVVLVLNASVSAVSQVSQLPILAPLSTAHTVVVGKDDAEVKQRAEAIGRDVEDLKANAIAGTPAEVVDRLGQFAAVGSQRQYVQIMDLQDLAHLDLIAAEVLPQVS